jgi:hypothetical protein
MNQLSLMARKVARITVIMELRFDLSGCLWAEAEAFQAKNG